jgi:uncharacterized protein (TIGR00730 family)
MDKRSSAKSSYTPPIKSYRDEEFLNSPSARTLRILAEYLGPQERFRKHRIKDTIVFFGSARIRSMEEARAAAHMAATPEEEARAQQMLAMAEYYEATRTLARRLTEWSLSLDDKSRRFVVCSGAGPGLMEATNRGAAEGGGESVGLGISLPMEDTGNPYITPDLSLQFHYFFMRKFWFAYLAKAFIAMPGGYGTLDEIMEILTLIQTRKMQKKVPIVLFGTEFWDNVINFPALVKYGTISPGDVDLFIKTDSIDEAFDYITDGLLRYGLQHPGGSM